MNIVRELRIKKGVQQKELAIEIGVSSAAVSNWEKGKSDPSGDRLKKLADFFGVEESFILGYGSDSPSYFVPENPSTSGKTETEQIIQYVLDKLTNPQETFSPRTEEAQILARGVDRLPQEQRKQALKVVKAMFEQYSDYFNKGESDET